MKKLRLFCLFGAFIFCGVTNAQTLKVITTQPDLADLVRTIGGGEVTVESLTKGREDLHMIRIRPSTLIKARRADVFIQLGLNAEHSWVPALLRNARNEKIRPGQNGFVNASRGIKPKRVPASKSRGISADLHPSGNPHYNLDPVLMKTAGANIRNALKLLRPAKAKDFDRRYKAWCSKLDKRLVVWRKKMLPFKGRPFVEEHDSWIYFASRFGLKIVARLEPKPGLSPTPSHLKSVVGTMKQKHAKLVVTRNRRIDIARKVAAQVGGSAKVIPLSSTKDGALKGYIVFMDQVVDHFVAGLGDGK